MSTAATIRSGPTPSGRTSTVMPACTPSAQIRPPYLNFSRVAGATIDSQGRIIVVGSTGTGGAVDFRVVRLLSTGLPDNSFSGDGMVDIAFNLGGNNSDAANAVAVDDQDRIVVVGEVERAATGDFDFGTARLTTTGALDTSFNGSGKRVTHFDLAASMRFDNARAVAIDSARPHLHRRWRLRRGAQRHPHRVGALDRRRPRRYQLLPGQLQLHGQLHRDQQRSARDLLPGSATPALEARSRRWRSTKTAPC